MSGPGTASVMTAVVSLGSPPAGTATVQYATVDGSAVAGVDYLPASGTVTFAPGQTAAKVAVPVLADPAANADRAFAIALSNPIGCVLGAARVGACVISVLLASTALSSVSIGPVSVSVAPAPAALTALSASGNQFVDASGAFVRLRGVNWYGFDGPDLIVHGLYAGRSYKGVLDQLRALGFNCVRLPFCDDLLTSTVTFGTASGNQYVDPHANPDLIGLTPLQALDAIVAYGASIGMRFVLDHHRLSATSVGAADSGYGTDGWPAADPATGTYLYGGSASPRPYTAATWAAMWTTLARHFTVGAYASNPGLRNAIAGYDPHNEPFHLTWATWAGMCEALDAQVGAIAPDWMAFVEGVAASADGTDKYWYGGYLHEALTRPVNLGARQNKLAYSVHDYGHSVSPQPWLQSVASAPLSALPVTAQVTGSVSGTTLTVTAVASGTIHLGDRVPAVSDPTYVTAFGSGTGGTGTYTLSTAGSVASGPMVLKTDPYPDILPNAVPGYPANLEPIFDHNWGDLYRQNKAPILIGEFGGGFGFDAATGDNDPFQTNAAFEAQWQGALVRYANGQRNDGTSMVPPGGFGPSYAYFALNPESGNPLGGLLRGDYLTVQGGKMDLILPLLAA